MWVDRLQYIECEVHDTNANDLEMRVVHTDQRWALMRGFLKMSMSLK